MHRLIGRTPVGFRRGKFIACDALLIQCADGTRWALSHLQDCCEIVEIEDIAGDLSDLLGSAILEAERRTADGPCAGESTWTFFHLGGFKGRVTIRFLGESNGYYGEDADLYEIDEAGAIQTTLSEPQPAWACGVWGDVWQ